VPPRRCRGIPAGTTVVPKIGFIDDDVHDSVRAGDLHRGAASWSVLAAISQQVWSFEATR